MLHTGIEAAPVQEHAELDIAFEDIVSRPEALLRQLAARLGLQGSVDCAAVLRELSSLPVPTDWMDPVTQVGGRGRAVTPPLRHCVVSRHLPCAGMHPALLLD